MFSETLKRISNTLQNLRFVQPSVDEIVAGSCIQMTPPPPVGRKCGSEEIGTGVSTSDTENLIYVAVQEEILKEVVPYNRSGKGKLSYLSLGKNAMRMLQATVS